MTGLRGYVTSLVEESLGLVRGTLEPGRIPEDLIASISSAIRGQPPKDATGPSVEKQILALQDEERRSAMDQDGFFVRKARWPKAAPFAVCLTHDVDNISRSRGHIWKTRSRFNWWDLVRGLLGVISLYNNVDLISSGEESRGFHSSFYYLSSNYPLSDVSREAARIRASGWDVGLHGDFGTHDSQEKLHSAVTLFSKGMGFMPSGLREHFLRFDYSKSWKIMEAEGFDYDTTVGTTDRLGFRLGLATPFHPPDDGWSPMNLLELPLVLMDTTLWGYLRRPEEEGLGDVMRMMSSVEEVEGLFTLLWHQEAVRMKGGRMYWRVLDEVLRRGCFVGSGAEVSRWWRTRAVPLVKEGKLIRLGGTPPTDLVLRLSVTEGRVPQVTSGSFEKIGNEYLVRPQGSGFRLAVT